ncbi:hypothetical protein HDV01_004549 [Terramyces sp. JEL0728]|nr:hypothetical protein HDV01_004549 [Terramyces sp. JEL0728]
MASVNKKPSVSSETMQDIRPSSWDSQSSTSTAYSFTMERVRYTCQAKQTVKGFEGAYEHTYTSPSPATQYPQAQFSTSVTSTTTLCSYSDYRPPTPEQKKFIQNRINTENAQKELVLVEKQEIKQVIKQTVMPTAYINTNTCKLRTLQKQLISRHLDNVHDPQHRFHPSNHKKLMVEGMVIDQQLKSCSLDPLQLSIGRL